MMFYRTVFLSIFSLVSSDIFDSAIERKINTTLKTTNTSDTALLLDIDTFVSYNGLRSGNSSLITSTSKTPPGNLKKGSLRVYPEYWPIDLKVFKVKMINLMKQAIYTTQERMDNLIPILKRYENDPNFRMAFIFNRLKQILIDMRRVYTLAWRSRQKTSPKVMRVYEQIFWYAHIVKKYFDVLYIVEYVIEFQDEHVKSLPSYDINYK